MNIRLQNILFAIIRIFVGIAALCTLWALIVHLGFATASLLPAPERVFIRMFDLNIVYMYAFQAVPITIIWTLAAWIIGLATSLALAVIVLKCSSLATFFSLIFAGGRTLPSVIAIPMFAVILGPTRTTTLICAAFLVMCYSEMSFLDSLETLTRKRKALAESLGLRARQSLLLVVIPGAARAWKAITAQTFGISLVVTVAGEMILSMSNSVGDDVAEMAWLLRMADLYAVVGWLVIWVLVLRWIMELFPYLLEYPARLMTRRIDKRLVD